MKPTSSRLLLVILVLALGSIASVRAQWLTHTPDTSQPSGMATNASFPFGLTGNVTTSIGIFSDGFNNGVPGVTPNPFTNVTSTFLSYYATNPGNTFDFLSVSSNDTRDVFMVTMDFSHLAGGVLPAGSTIAFLDVDNNEDVFELNGFAQGGLVGQYNNAWLSQFNGLGGSPPAVFDYDNAGGGTGGVSATSFYTGFGGYSLVGDPSNQDSAFQGFKTTQALGSLSFIYNVTDPTGGPTLISDTYGVAIQVVPEPSPLVFFVLGAGFVAFAVSRRTFRRIS